MKIQLDTTNKTIKVEDSVNINEFFEIIKKILPNNEWKEFKLETSTIINWSDPIVIKYYNPYNPTWVKQSETICDTNGTQHIYSLTPGIYNIEC